MPRRPRVHLDGLPLHIVQRGHNREACFFADEDYFCYLYWLCQALTVSGCALHAYVLMTNHVHLLVTPQRTASVPGLLISLGRRYVQYVNRHYRRTGTLWDSRYKSSLIQADAHLLLCQRYIELNPVRAAMVADPAHYRWSSYRANALGAADELLAPHPEYLALGPPRRSARPHTGPCSARSSTTRRLRICGSRSTRINRWAMRAFWRRSNVRRDSGGRPNGAGGRSLRG